MDCFKAYEKILDGYLQAAAPPVEEEPVAAPDACLDCNVEVFVRCQSAGCKKKRTKECTSEMCFQCCFNLKSACSAHFRMRKKRETEDKYIEEGLKSSSRQKTSFYHYEEKFMKSDQTVVIWCLQDFLLRKEWSADTMALYQREQRTLDLLRRRSSQASDLSVLSGTSATSGSAGSTSPRAALAASQGQGVGRGRGRKPAAVQSVSEGSEGSTAEDQPPIVGSPQVASPSPASTAGKRGRPKKAVQDSEEVSGTPARSASSKGASAKCAAAGATSNAGKGVVRGRAKRFQKVQQQWKLQLGL